MSRATVRPAPFKRDNATEGNYLVVMHYMSELLWQRGLGVEALETLTNLLGSGDEIATTSSTHQAGGHAVWPPVRQRR